MAIFSFISITLYHLSFTFVGAVIIGTTLILFLISLCIICLLHDRGVSFDYSLCKPSSETPHSHASEPSTAGQMPLKFRNLASEDWVCGIDFKMPTFNCYTFGGSECDTKKKQGPAAIVSNENTVEPRRSGRPGRPPYKCTQCGIIFASHVHYASHLRTHANLPFACEYCFMTFTQQGHLNDHKATHMDKRPFTCDECPKAFKCRASLKQHMKVHSSDRYLCHLCPADFSYKASLENHIRVHSGERPFQCDFCSKRFNQRSHLLDHRRIHTGDRKHKCEICSKAFVARSHLRVHLRNHTGERPFACDACPKAFTTMWTLRAHQRTHSRNVKPAMPLLSSSQDPVIELEEVSEIIP